jgi:hypothetical protein
MTHTSKSIALILCWAFALMCGQADAQLDTTLKEFCPLKVGNTWQYQYTTPTGSQYVGTCTITGDTVLPDGHRYFQGCGLVRIDSLLRVWQNYGGVRTDTTEECRTAYAYNVYRLDEQVGTVWRTCQNLIATLGYPWFLRFDGISTMTIFGQPRAVMHFTPGAYIPDAGDTIWYPLLNWSLVRGIGVYSEETVEMVERHLIGAIINGIGYGTLAGVKTDPSITPDRFLLEQNFPNPFNASTIIRYDIPEEAYVSLKVFDLLGREVAKLVNEYQPAGHYQKVFEPANLASGLYLYRLSADRFTQTRLMSFVK